MNAAACPDKSALESYALGTLPVDEAERLAEHLDECSRCESTIHGVEGVADTVISGLRKAEARNPYADEPGYQKVAEMLKSLRGTGVSLRGTGVSPVSNLDIEQDAIDEDLGRLGQYDLLSKLGSGGMGTVYRARHTKLDRVVAVKLLSEERLRDEQSVARFEREMKAVGKLDHPNIVRAHDAGEADGRHYLAMEFVQGMDLSKLSKRCGPLDVADACELVRQAAIGLAHAHEHGLVHRDVKPSNLMLNLDRQVKILDLGLALLQEESDEQELTSTGQMMGTLDYMAPEQCGGAHEADARADVYAMGATLYKLLCGHSPYSGSSRYDTRTKKLAAILQERPPALAERRGDLPEDLLVLIERMMAREPADRPATSSEVAEALSAWTTGSDLVALLQRPAGKSVDASVSTQATMSTAPFASAVLSDTHSVKRATPAPAGQPPRRSRRTVIAAAAAAAVVLLGVYLIIRDRDGKEKARIALQDGDSIEVVEKTKKDDDRKTRKAERKTVSPAKITSAPMALDQRDALSRMALVSDPAKIEGIDSWTIETRGHRGPIHAVVHSPDGKRIASAGEDGSIRIWNSQSGALKRVLVGDDFPVRELAWSPDGRSIASVGYHWIWGKEALARVWDAETGKLLRVFDHANGDIAWSPDSTRLAVGWAWAHEEKGEIRIWDVNTGKRTQSPQGGGLAIAWEPNGKRIASGGIRGQLFLLDAETGEITWEVAAHEKEISDVAWSADGRRLASAGHLDGKVRLWAPGSNNAPAEWSLGMNGSKLAFSPNGKRLAALGRGGRFLIDVNVPGRQSTLESTSLPLACSWSPDGDSLVLAGMACSLSKIEAESQREILQIPGHYIDYGGSATVALSPDGKTLLTTGPDNIVALYDLYRATQARRIRIDGGRIEDVAWRPDGKVLAIANAVGNSGVELRDASAGKLLERISLPDAAKGQRIFGISYSPDGRHLAVSTVSNTYIWNTAASPAHLKHRLDVGRHVAWSPKGDAICVQNRVFDTDSAAVVADFRLGGLAINHRQWSPDGTMIAFGTAIGVQVLDVSTRRRLASHGLLSFKAVTWTADGESVICIDHGGVVGTLNLTGQFVERYKGAAAHHDAFPAFSSNRKLAAVRTPAATVELWDIEHGRRLGTYMSSTNDLAVAISPSGHVLGPDGFHRYFVYVVQTDRGQETLTPAEFAEKYGWKNNPDKVRLIGAGK